jgi:VanZ family protein
MLTTTERLDGPRGPGWYVLATVLYVAAMVLLSSIPDPGIEEQHAFAAVPGLLTINHYPIVRLAWNLAHVPLYAGLVFVALQAVARGKAHATLTPGVYWAIFGAALACAALDEWYQSLVPGRSASVTDFLLDVVGSGAMLLILRKTAGRKVGS